MSHFSDQVNYVVAPNDDEIYQQRLDEEHERDILRINYVVKREELRTRINQSPEDILGLKVESGDDRYRFVKLCDEHHLPYHTNRKWTASDQVVPVWEPMEFKSLAGYGVFGRYTVDKKLPDDGVEMEAKIKALIAEIAEYNKACYIYVVDHYKSNIK